MVSTPIPDENYAVAMVGDRSEPPLVGDERCILLGFLEFHRVTFSLKWRGLTNEQLSRRALAPSALTMHGLVRHFAGFERWWLQNQFLGTDAPKLYYTDDEPDQDFEGLDGDPHVAYAAWERECEKSRNIISAASLDDTGTRTRDAKPISLRRIVVHLIAEYARHNGHADLLREHLDGTTGY